jgi:hypothetical protein
MCTVNEIVKLIWVLNDRSRKVQLLSDGVAPNLSFCFIRLTYHYVLYQVVNLFHDFLYGQPIIVCYMANLSLRVVLGSEAI